MLLAIMLMDEDKKGVSQNSLPRNESYGHELSLQKIIVIYLIQPDGPVVVVLKCITILRFY